MKVRTGFVPNSSSSSFIVALPKKPKTYKELYAMVYGELPEDQSVYEYCKDTTRLQAVKTLFKDVIAKESKATRKALMEELQNRYRYFVSTWNCDDGFYQRAYSKLCWGTDPKLVEQIRQLHVDEEAISKAHTKMTHDYLNSRVPVVPYASDCKDEKGNPRYTAKQIKDFNAYMKKVQKLRETEEYKKMDQEEWTKRRTIWDAIRKLEIELAKKDMEALLQRTKNMFLAVLSYSDNDGCQGAAMEHGDLWDNLMHIKISHH